MKLKWKVCGMRDMENIKQVMSLKPNYMGFIFYKGSPRYVGENWSGVPVGFPPEIEKVGVFVNESEEKVIDLADKYQLQWLQLHGDESPEYCRKLQEKGFNLIKVVHLENTQDLDMIAEFAPYIEYYLFDTKSPQYGGTGKTFNWESLSHYKLKKPFILSGGVSLENISGLEVLEGLPLVGIDVNSRFETEPAIKNIDMLESLKKKIKG